MVPLTPSPGSPLRGDPSSAVPAQAHGPEAGWTIEAHPKNRPGGIRGLVIGIATVGGVGFLPGAPGSFGAALAVLIFVLFSPWHPALLGLSWVALLALGVWAADGAEAAFGREDDGRIVIDEVVGQLLALAPLAALVHGCGGWPISAAAFGGWLVTGFVLFRCFDIAKPGPVRWAERRFRGGVGVMMDDVVAGALAAAGLAALLLAAHAAGLDALVPRGPA
jgi:phosphatidylglycerophosphatase A